MNTKSIIENVVSKGFLLWLADGKLMVKPKVDDNTRELLRQHKVSIISYLTQAGPFFVAGGSEQGKAHEIATTGTPESVLSDDLVDELRDERAAILEYDGGLSRDEAEARAATAYPCRCFGRRFWVSKYGAVRCEGCHPPAVEAHAVRWFEIPETGGAE